MSQRHLEGDGDADGAQDHRVEEAAEHLAMLAFLLKAEGVADQVTGEQES